MLEVLKEIDKVRKERTYFHEIPGEKDINEAITTVGKVIDVHGVIVLCGVEMDEEERDFYDKIMTVIEYAPERVKYSRSEEKFAIAKSFKDPLFKQIVRYMQGEDPRLDEDIANRVKNEIKSRIAKDGIVESIEGMNLVTLDDGIESIYCIDSKGEIEQDGLYEVELSRSQYLTDGYLILRTEDFNIYDLDKVKRL